MNDRGLTLIEVMITTAILSVIFLFLGMTMMSASREYSVSSVETDLHAGMRQAVLRIFDELEDASTSSGNLEVATDGSWIKFRVPVNIPGWEADPTTPQWGARFGRDQFGNPVESSGGCNVIAFDTSDVENVSEGTVIRGGLNININTEPIGQKDMTDVFVRGHLLFIYDPDGLYPAPLDGLEVIRQITGDWVVQRRAPSGNLGGDVDDDGTDTDDPPDGVADDYLFRQVGNRIVVNLWGLHVNRAARLPVLVNHRMSVVLANP